MVPMVESTAFKRGYKNQPSRLLLEVQASNEVQVYSAKVHFRARFAGLRWLMYNHRIISFMVFTTAFWVSEMLFAVVGWLALRNYLMPGDQEEGIKREGRRDKIKDEDSGEVDLSDLARTDPRSGRPIATGPTVKLEDSDDSGLDELGIPSAGTDPYDEDEDEKPTVVAEAGGPLDSAIGTSYSESSGNPGVSRRRSRGGHGGG